MIKTLMELFNYWRDKELCFYPPDYNHYENWMEESMQVSDMRRCNISAVYYELYRPYIKDLQKEADEIINAEQDLQIELAKLRAKAFARKHSNEPK